MKRRSEIPRQRIFSSSIPCMRARPITSSRPIPAPPTVSRGCARWRAPVEPPHRRGDHGARGTRGAEGRMPAGAATRTKEDRQVTAGRRRFLALAGAAAALLLAPPGDAFEYDSSRGVLTVAPQLAGVIASVVNISTRHRVPVNQNPLLQDPFFRHFFGLPEFQAPQQREALSAGSGVIVDASRGLVLTNNHVVEQADQIVVSLFDGRQEPAEVVGTDAATDIALLRIRAKDLRAAPLGDSAEVRVGDL